MAKLTTGLLIGVGAALALSACAQAPQAPKTVAPADYQQAEAAKAQMMQADKNEMMAKEFFSMSTPWAEKYAMLAPDYIQHNPVFMRFDELNHVTGRAGFQMFIETMTKLNGGKGPFPLPDERRMRMPKNEPKPNFVYQVFAGPSSVTVIHQQYRPMPGERGKFYPVYTFDTWRVANGMFAEHWDTATLPEHLPIWLREPASKLHYPKQEKMPAHHAGA